MDGRQKTSTASKKNVIKADPPKLQKPDVTATKIATMIPIKEKPVENLIDDHAEDFDVTPGMDERGKLVVNNP